MKRKTVKYGSKIITIKDIQEEKERRKIIKEIKYLKKLLKK